MMKFVHLFFLQHKPSSRTSGIRMAKQIVSYVVNSLTNYDCAAILSC